MDNYVITISRKFGSLGHQIAGELGRRLEIPVYDRSCVEAQVQSRGLENRMQAGAQSRGMTVPDHASWRRQEAGTTGRDKQKSIFPWKRDQKAEQDKAARAMIDAQAEGLRGYVRESSCIILGRGGDEVFRGYKRCLNVYIFAPDRVRIENCVRMLNTDEQAARALIRREDKARDAYRAMFCTKASDPTYGRQLLIDTSIFGVDESTKILEEAVRYLFYDNAKTET